MRYIAPIAGAATIVLLLALQTQGVLEYTAGVSAYTRNTMIAAAFMVALLPLQVEAAWAIKARFSAVVMAIATVALLWYSIPATLGRIGEAKEAKVVAAGDVASARAELASVTQTLNWARPDKLAECVGAPDPLPPNGWPRCRQKTGTVSALEDRQAKLEAQIKSGPATGDVGSDTLSWATFGAKVENIRRSQSLAYVLGMDFAVFGLACFVASFIRANRKPVAITEGETFTDDDLGGLRKLLDGEPPKLPPTAPMIHQRAGDEIKPWVREFFKDNGRRPSKPELRAAFPDVAEVTAWRRTNEVEEEMMSAA